MENKKIETYTKSLGETSCKHCQLSKTPEGHDGCLGTLIGLMNACCGHGLNRSAYVQFLDSKTVQGEDAVIIQKILKKQT